MAEQVDDFIDAGRMRNRNIRLEVNQEEALLRAAEAEGRNVSAMIRQIITGRSPDLVTRGLLCPTCFAVDCERHKPVAPHVIARRKAKAGAAT